MWNETEVLDDLYIVLKEKFFNKNEEYIGNFKNETSKITHYEEEILHITKQFKNMFVEQRFEMV